MCDKYHSSIICLGGNALATRGEIELATELLAQLGIITAQTESYPTPPEYEGEKFPYLNRVVLLHTSLSLQELEKRTKSYEYSKRAVNKEKNRVNIDIDIVTFDNQTIRPADASASYFRIGISKLQKQSLTV